MEGGDRRSPLWGPYDHTAPPPRMSREDPTFILILLLAAHPNLAIDYERMSDASYAMPDPRMWTTAEAIRQQINQLEDVAGTIRALASAVNNGHINGSANPDNPFPGINAGSAIRYGYSRPQESDEEEEARARQILNTAWHNYMSNYYNNGTTVAADLPESSSQSSQYRTSRFREAISPPTESESSDNPATTAQLEADIRRMAEFVQQNVDRNPNHGVWVDQRLPMDERAELEEMRRASREASQNGNHLPSNGSNGN